MLQNFLNFHKKTDTYLLLIKDGVQIMWFPKPMQWTFLEKLQLTQDEVASRVF